MACGGAPRARNPLKRLPPQDDAKNAAKAGPYLTSVGMACAIMNRLAARLLAEPDPKTEGPAISIESLWYEVGARFPRADLIVAREGKLDAQGYEKYVKQAGGVAACLAGCHEDSMEALMQVGQRLARLSRERLGDRARKNGHGHHPALP